MPELIGEDAFRQVAEAALSLEGVDGVEVLAIHEWSGLTRFANSEIHQSTASEDIGIRVRVVRDGRLGVVATNAFTPEGAAEAARSAKELADVAGPDPSWPGLAPKAAYPQVDRFDDATAAADPETRAEAVAALVGRCPSDAVAAGAYETRTAEVAYANTEGQTCWAPWTQATLTAVVSGSGGDGFAETAAGRADAIDGEAVGARAAGLSVRSRNPRPIEPGIYTVVLEPAATATIVGFLAWIGFAGREYIEGRSCFSGKAGTPVGAPGVSIWDDATDPDTIGVGFDFEGTPRRKVELIRDGVFVDAVYDRRTAHQAERASGSTGHGLPPPNPEGPFPLNLRMATGDATRNEMIESTERGLLVTRFHYANVVNPVESTLTGMTRDGLFLIENGEVTTPVRNLRFTQSAIGALRSVSMIGREAELCSEFFFSASLVPALKIDAFHFSSASDH
ncbi:MAG TPA: TldD/PmbA family protein [Actinomycetota bacterium]|nr:TldD/PmbA family protein [Actinomycetota bacterium]